MDNFFQDAIITVLTSTLNELIVLGHGKNLPLSTNQKVEPKNKLPNNQMLKSNVSVTTLNEIKFVNDLKKLTDIILETLKELVSSGTYNRLYSTIAENTKRNNEEEYLINENKVNLTALRSIKSKLGEFKSEADCKVLQASETLNNLKSDWRIISKVNELEYELVKKWEHTRLSQATIVGKKDEDTLKSNLKRLVAKTRAEQRVIIESQSYSKQQFAKYYDMIAMWKERYARELNELLASIAEKESKIKEVKKTYDKYYESYCKRGKFIAEYLEHKAEQNRLLELQKKRIESAVKIQAWWRGLMVRRCLGPFKKKAKKGKKAKKPK